MARFQLLPGVGNHYEGNGEKNRVEYQPGDIIESDKPLDQMFAYKFERLADDEDKPVKKSKKGKKLSAAL